MKMLKKKNAKRIVGLLLIVCVVAAIIPGPCFAYDKTGCYVTDGAKQLKAVIDEVDKPDVDLTPFIPEAGKSYYLKVADKYALDYDADGTVKVVLFKDGSNSQKVQFQKAEGGHVILSKDGESFGYVYNRGIVKGAGTGKHVVVLRQDVNGNLYISPIEDLNVVLAYEDGKLVFEQFKKSQIKNCQFFKAVRVGYVPETAVAFAKKHVDYDRQKAAEKGIKLNNGNSYFGGKHCTSSWLCASYVSECLIQGGFKMKRISVAKDLFNYLDKSSDWKRISVRDAKVGDVVFYTNKGHMGLVSKISGNGSTKCVYVTEHNAVSYDHVVMRNRKVVYKDYNVNYCFRYIGE